MNMARGKSEALFTLRGPLSRTITRQVYLTQQGQIPCAIGGTTSVIRAVHLYKHLGGIVTMDRKLGAEVSHRATAANIAVADLSHSVFSSADVCIPVKVRAISTLVDSRMFYNVGVWHSPK